MRKFLYIFAISLTFFAITKNVSADAFSIHFFYDSTTKVLKFDNKASSPVSHDKDKYISIVEFSKNNQSGPYTLGVYDKNNIKIASTEFDKKNGSFSLDIPYYSLGYTIKIIETPTNKELLSTDISSFNSCNGNGICEFEKGENSSTCLGDCASSHVNYSDQTKKLLEDNNGILKDPQTDQVLLQDKSLPSYSVTPYQSTSSTSNQPETTKKTTSKSVSMTTLIILLFIVFAVLIAGIFFYKKYSSKKDTPTE